MILTAALSVYMAGTVGHLLDELNDKYFSAYDHLAQANIKSLERAVALRRMMIAWGSNFPANEGSLASLLAEAHERLAVVPDAARNMILGGTARRIYPELGGAAGG